MDKPTIISTALALILAAQNRGLTANIRHLLNIIRASPIFENPALTKKWLKLGFQEPAYLFTDTLGRVWGKGENGKYYPFHFKSGKSLIGYRVSIRAAN